MELTLRMRGVRPASIPAASSRARSPGHQRADGQDARPHRAADATRYRRRGNRMTRREFFSLIGGAAAAWPLAARAQQAERMRRIGVVNVIAETDSEALPRMAAFEMALRELGWVKERDLRIDYYW